MSNYDILDWFAQMEREDWPLIGYAFRPDCDMDEEEDEIVDE